MFKWIEDFIKRHKFILGIISFLTFTVPGALQAWWGFFSGQPFYQWLRPHIPVDVKVFILGHGRILQWLAGIAFIIIVVNSLRERCKKRRKPFPHIVYTNDLYQDILWTWDYNRGGRVINLTARCPEHKAPVSIQPTDRQLNPSNGNPYQGYHVHCPQCPDKIVGVEQLSHYAALDRDRPSQPDLHEQALSLIQGKIYSGAYSEYQKHKLEEKQKPKLKIHCDSGRGCKVLFERTCAFRVGVNNAGNDPVRECKGKLIDIQMAKNGFYLLEGQGIPLTFAPSEQSDWNNKTIYRGSIEHLDILFTELKSDGGWTIQMGTKDRTWYYDPLDKIFKDFDKYIVHIQIVSPSETVDRKLLFNWTGNPQTSHMSIHDPSAIVR